MDLYFDLQLFGAPNNVTLSGATISGQTVTLGSNLAVGFSAANASILSTSWVSFALNKTSGTGTLKGDGKASDIAGYTGFGFQVLGTSLSTKSTGTMMTSVGVSRMFVNTGTYNFNNGNAIKEVTVGGASTFNFSDIETGLKLNLAKASQAHTFNFNNSTEKKVVFDKTSDSSVGALAFHNNKGTFSLTSASFTSNMTATVSNGNIITLTGAAKSGGNAKLTFKGDNNVGVVLTNMTGTVTGSVDSMKSFVYGFKDAGTLNLTSVKSSAVSINGGTGANVININTLAADSSASINAGAGADNVTLTSIAAGLSAAVDLGNDNDTVSIGTLSAEGKLTIKGGKGTDSIVVDSVGAEGALKIEGGEDNDTISVASLSSSAKVTIDGGKGENVISLSGVGTETLLMSSLTGSNGTKNTVYNWFESTGDTEKGNVVSIGGGIADLAVSEVTAGKASFYWGTGASAVTAETKDAAGTSGASKLGINVLGSDGVKSALLVGTDSLNSAMNIRFDNYNYIIGVKNTENNKNGQTLNLGDTSKRIVHLANPVGETTWDDQNNYKDITTVVASSVGKSLIINGTSLAGSLVAGGANDSLWGGGNVATDSESNHDTLVGSSVTGGTASNVHLYTGFDEGIDIVTNYAGATTKAKADIIHFLGGAGYQEASNGVFKVGEDEKNHFEIQATAETGGNKFWYGYGLDAENGGLAIADLSSGGSTLYYDSLGSFYFGQGEKSVVSIDSALKTAAKLNWDGGAGTFSVGAIDGTSAVEGAMLVGLANSSQTVKGSNVGASSISGGVVVGDWSDTGRDTLIGGSKETMFYVGKGMGNDEIQNLVKNDKIVFLNTKYEDLTTDLTKDYTADTDMTFKFSNGARITASTASSTALSKISSLTLYFDDKDAVWDGKTWTVTDKQ